MSDRALFTVGVFAGILRGVDGRLLLRRRVEEGSILPGQSFKGCWELPGGGVQDLEKISYAYLSRELERELREELDFRLQLDPMPAFFPAPFKGPKGYDLALVTPILMIETAVFKGETIWVSPSELEQLAREFVAPNRQTGADGKGLLSGYGKRMHCLALAAFSLRGSGHAKQAASMLVEIQKTW